jgi:hypothetical protein
MSRPSDVRILISMRIAFAFGLLCALGLIACGRLLVPATNNLSVAAAAFVVTLYAIVGWFGVNRLDTGWSPIASIAVPLGIPAGSVFAAEVVL